MIDTEHCTGCSACKAICSRNAIKMKPNIGGFLFPVIDDSKCVDCGCCHKVCDVANADERNHVHATYALKHKDKAVIGKSTSGGAFYLLAERILADNGTIYGAAFDKNYKVGHVRCDNLSYLYKLQKSKYVQSDIQDVYKDLADDLKTGRKVLFSGTACQCSGIVAYLKERRIDTENLLVVDLICHGTPSPQIWHDYLQFRYVEGKEITNVDFRDKRRSWRDFRMAITYSDGKKKTYRQNEDFFTVLFFHNFILRQSCYDCKYTSTDRISDITLGDFWGLEEFYPEFNDDKGTSAIIVSSEKGEKIFSEVSGGCNYISIKEDEIKRRQPNLKRSSPYNPRYNEFWETYKKEGFLEVTKRYADNTIIGQLKRKYLFKFLYYTGVFKILLKIKEKL